MASDGAGILKKEEEMVCLQQQCEETFLINVCACCTSP